MSLREVSCELSKLSFILSQPLFGGEWPERGSTASCFSSLIGFIEVKSEPSFYNLARAHPEVVSSQLPHELGPSIIVPLTMEKATGTEEVLPELFGSSEASMLTD